MADRQAVVPPHLTVRVTCDQGHILSGLFLVFRLKPRAAGEQPWDQVARVMESTADPGEEPVDPNPPAASSSAPAAPAKGKKPKPPPKPSKAQLAYRAKHATWETQRAAHLDTPPDPSTEFVVGFVDGAGYLVPVHSGSNPWYDTEVGRDPDAYKLGLNEIYEACLLRHPDPALARAVARHLNGAAVADDDKYEIASWGTLTRDITVTSQSTQTGDQYVFQLSEDPSHFVPAGPSRYGGWSIYLDMPHAMCANVPAQVKKLASDLGKLRYPVGETYPFEPDDDPKTYLLSRSLEKRVRFAAEKAKNPKLKLSDAAYMREHVHYVQSQIASSIGGFQEHLAQRSAFAMSYKDRAFGGGARSSWFYLLGNAFDFAEGSSDARAWQLPRYTYLGVVDRFTGGMIDHWEQHGLRKPGSLLVESAMTNLWLQERAAVSVDAWAMALGAFGVQYARGPLVGGSTFRRLVDNPWPGSIKASLHNSGFAIDLAGGAYRKTKSIFPIRYEADWIPKKKVVNTSAQRIDRGNLDYLLYFKLYAHSALDVFGSGSSAAMATLRANLTELAGDGSRSLARKLRSRFGDLTDSQIDPYIRAATADAVSFIRKLIASSDADLLAKYFRHEVRQFLPNAYEADAGTSMPAHRPHEGDSDYPAQSWAKSWVNMSALGHPFGMERIGAHQGEVRDPSFYFDTQDTAKTKPAAVSMLTFASESAALVGLLRDVSAPPGEAAENVHYDTPIPITVGKKPQIVMTVRPADLERDFIRDWHRALDADASAGIKPQLKPSTNPAVATGAQIRVVLSVLPEGAKHVNRALAVLRQFGTQRFVAMHVGSLCPVPRGVLMTGDALAAALEAGVAAFQGGVKARWALADAAEQTGAPATPPATAAEKRRVSRREAAKKTARDKEVSKAAPDWTVVIQPVFVRGNVDVAALPFLPQHSAILPRSTPASHLEWWHFQHRFCGENWGAAVAECGYSRLVLDTPRAGVPDAAPIIHRGVGFDGELDNKVGQFGSSQPGNAYFAPTGG